MNQNNDKKNIESIYPLSHAQHAFLTHSLQPGQPDLGLLQNYFRMRGELQVLLFKQAWSQVIQRHPAVRTSVHWEDLEKPLQVVHRQVELPWEQLDWRKDTEEDQHHQFAALLTADRDRGLVLTRTPVMRLTLIQLTTNTYRFIWTCHHLLLDGWSEAIILKEVVNAYTALCKGQKEQGEIASSYRDYIVWLQQQDLSKVETFWRHMLSGFSVPVLLGQSSPGDQLTDKDRRYYKKRRYALSATDTDQLQDFVRQCHLTLNTLIQGTWALLLSRYSKREDIVFGTTFSGRPADLPGIESMVGLFINTLPIRVQVSLDSNLISWLSALQTQLTAMISYAYVPLAQIQNWSNLPGNQRLFDSLVAFENYPWDNRIEASDLEINEINGDMATVYPLAIMVRKTPTLSLQMIYDSRRFTETMIDQISAHFQTILSAFLKGDQPLSNLLTELPLEEIIPTPDDRTNNSVAILSTTAPTDVISFDEETDYTSLEILLTGIWKDVLDVTHIDLKNNFFELGGHSLTVVQLFSKTEAILGKSLPLAAIFEAPTIEQMASLIQCQDWAPFWTSLVAIQPNGAKPPLFFTHTYLGNILGYARIANYLGKDQPFYGLQAQAIHDELVNYRTIEEMAAHYLNEIRQIQPEGPYYLGAFSYGLVVFEMAQQLQRQGQEVAHLVLLEAFGPGYQVPIPKVLSQRNLRTRLVYYWREISNRSFLTMPAYVIRGVTNRLKARWTSRVLANYQRRGCPLPRDLHAIQVESYLALAAENYKPQIYPGKITLLASRNMPGYEKLGWEAWASDGVDVHFISEGEHHHFITEPRVQEVSAHLKKILSHANPAPPKP